MSTARSIQVSITHVALGIAIGSIIEGLLPKLNAGASLSTQVFETLVQVGLNGAALSLVSTTLQDNDPTFGIPFSMALFQAQPELQRRVELLGVAVKDRVAQGVQQTGPLVQAG